MEPFALWLKSTALSEAIVGHSWIWPLCEVIHFIGLALVIGIVGFWDLRLIGFMKRVPMSAVKEFMPWGILGFGLNLVTGMVFLIGAPDQYVNNFAWWLKVSFLMLAGLNAMFFETTLGSRVMEMGPGEAAPLSFRLVGALSLFSWLMVLYWGRMMPFVGGSF